MKSQRKGWRYALIIIGLSFLAMLVMDFNSRTAELRRLTAEREQVRIQATSIVETKDALEAKILYATSVPAVREWAYEDNHMVMPGDVPVVPVAPKETTALPTPRPTATSMPDNNLQDWLFLFFGPQAP